MVEVAIPRARRRLAGEASFGRKAPIPDIFDRLEILNWWTFGAGPDFTGPVNKVSAPFIRGDVHSATRRLDYVPERYGLLSYRLRVWTPAPGAGRGFKQ